jgi:hypothetical protein
VRRKRVVKKEKEKVKEENPEMSRQDLMREVGRMWNEKKGDEEVEKEEVKEEVNKGKKGKNVI